MSVSLGELAVRFGCELRGDPGTRIERVGTLAHAQAGALAFLANPKYRSQLSGTTAAAVVLTAAAAEACPTAMLVCENPYATYARIAQLLNPPPAFEPGVHPSAVLSPGARIDPSACIGALAFIGEDAQVGARAFIGPHSVLLAGVRIGEDVRLVARVTLGAGTVVGARSVLHPGVVLGADGFGFAPERGTWVKVPQVGVVRLGADVEVGANTTIDRGAIEDTVIEDDVKLDNLVQVGHNVRIGAHTVIAGCTGISGSTTIGRRCMIGGACGIGGHISIADDVVVTGFSAIANSITKPGLYSSTLPVEEARAWRRLQANFKRSGLLAARVRRLEQASGIKSEQEPGDE
ncbi:MAG: UDP-3-O-(3-hydroxymyristoyl)glucosamine N-acyltransferase [Proteobacteria bacterium]|nr:UDP-3-O-(3-hydroxymyristoyl)glucosamine N-acyltransferase [Pseudomonadota bacterium]